jgi:mycothiol synthase
MSAILSRELPSPAIADGFTIRPLRGESEVEAWVKAHNGGFSDHYDPPADTAQDKRTAMQSPGYLPEADLVLADSADRVVGISYNWFERLEDDSRKGWVRSIAVLPEFRGRGLGKALLLASMHALKTAGYETVHLSVDTENQYGALALYMNAGFKVDSRMIVYRRAVDPNS